MEIVALFRMQGYIIQIFEEGFYYFKILTDAMLLTLRIVTMWTYVFI